VSDSSPCQGFGGVPLPPIVGVDTTSIACRGCSRPHKAPEGIGSESPERIQDRSSGPSRSWPFPPCWLRSCCRPRRHKRPRPLQVRASLMLGFSVWRHGFDGSARAWVGTFIAWVFAVPPRTSGQPDTGADDDATRLSEQNLYLVGLLVKPDTKPVSPGGGFLVTWVDPGFGRGYLVSPEPRLSRRHRRAVRLVG
jgi:hypothetical protein